ncbi:hypothetical protein GA0061102_106313 [Rhizobium miluonense]|uniref:Uncharacterized protein n=1 Tax=Rhizobium miluonense TaxID=411945 RepID=A0A1C3X7Z3_9HYPH|nr:hypothetical protein GA0061102_106313 [Rhizobium miluonense]
MGHFSTDQLPDLHMEILPPERVEESCTDAKACLCCRRMRSAARMDDDGCGICDECLAP